MIQAEDRADEQLQAIRELLNRLGLYENHITFYYIAYAVRFSLDDPEYLLMTTKLLYPKVAKQCGTTWMAVEHGIRYAIEKIWRKGKRNLKKQLCADFSSKPTPSEFLALSVKYVLRNCIDKTDNND